MNPDAATTQALQVFVGVMLVTVGLTLVVLLATWIVMAFALTLLFRKVGVKPWIAWVPYYRTWVWLELGGQQGWLALLSLVGGGMVTSIFLYLGMYRIGLAFRRDGGFLVLGIFFPFAWAFVLGGRDAVYEPWLLAWQGYPMPGVGYGSTTARFANDTSVVPGPPPPPPFWGPSPTWAAPPAWGPSAEASTVAAHPPAAGPTERLW